MLRRSSPSSSATLTGGDLSVDILHTEDSVQIGDGTNTLGSFSAPGGVRSLPVDVKATVGATDATLTGGTQRSKITDGADNVEIDDVGGEKALKVSVIASVGGGGGGTAATDSAAYTATASQFTPTGGAFDDTSSDALAEGEMGMVRLTSARAMHVDVRNASIPVTGTFWQATQPVSGTVGVSGSVAVTGTFWQATQPVSGTFWQATQPVSLASAVTIQDGGNSITIDDGAGSITVDGTVAVSGSVAVTGTFWQATQPVSGTFWQATQPVSIASMPTTAVTGTFWQATQPVSIAATVTTSTAGTVAHDAADSGNPIKIGGVARNVNPTEVANGDRVDASFDLSGRQIVSFSPRALVAQATGSQATTTEATMLATGGAGVFHDITALILTNSNTTTAAQVQIRDATAGTIRFEHMIPPNSGMVLNFPVPLCQTTANNNWTIDLNSAVSTVYYTVQALKRT